MPLRATSKPRTDALLGHRRRARSRLQHACRELAQRGQHHARAPHASAVASKGLNKARGGAAVWDARAAGARAFPPAARCCARRVLWAAQEPAFRAVLHGRACQAAVGEQAPGAAQVVSWGEGLSVLQGKCPCDSQLWQCVEREAIRLAPGLESQEGIVGALRARNAAQRVNRLKTRCGAAAAASQWRAGDAVARHETRPDSDSGTRRRQRGRTGVNISAPSTNSAVALAVPCAPSARPATRHEKPAASRRAANATALRGSSRRGPGSACHRRHAREKQRPCSSNARGTAARALAHSSSQVGARGFAAPRGAARRVGTARRRTHHARARVVAGRQRLRVVAHAPAEARHRGGRHAAPAPRARRLRCPRRLGSTPSSVRRVARRGARRRTRERSRSEEAARLGTAARALLTWPVGATASPLLPSGAYSCRKPQLA